MVSSNICYLKDNAFLLSVTLRQLTLFYSSYVLHILIKNFFYFLLFGHIHGMWKFQGQGSNTHQSRDPSHSSDNTRSLTHSATRELLGCFNMLLKVYPVNISITSKEKLCLDSATLYIKKPSGIYILPRRKAT